MFVKNNSTYQSTVLQSEETFHGFGMRNNRMSKKSMWVRPEAALSFLQKFGCTREQVVEMEQVHADRIQTVTKKDGGSYFSGIDGLLTSDRGILLVVRSLDCAPLLFFDPVKKVIGAAHVGWKGALLNLAGSMIRTMISEFRCDPKSILVAIGPMIRACCYTIPQERKELFVSKFGDNIRYIAHKKGEWYLNLPVVIYDELINSGVVPEHIDECSFCTKTMSDEFYSHRAEKDQQTQQEGANYSIIGIEE